MKYQFKINGVVYSAKDLKSYCLADTLKDYMDLEGNVSILDDLLDGKEIELDSFVSENSIDVLQLVEVKWKLKNY